MNGNSLFVDPNVILYLISGDATIINAEIKKLVISLRKNYNLKLPDSIIAASALYHNLPLITADKQLGQISELNILLYQK